MITIKSPREIEIMRRSGKITAKTLTTLMAAAKAGMTTRELDRIADESIRSMGGVPTFIGYNGYPSAICASVNDEVVHGMPGDRVLEEGDLLSLDIGTTLEGYVSDSAVTMAIGTPSPEAERLMRVTQECLMLGIAQMQVGNNLGDIGH
ncbi:MAG: M24 family metallopeptidase, partial [Vulcanimicrobiaceae bacterium]